MTGGEHYRESERLLAQARQTRSDGTAYYVADDLHTADLMAAHVHATLAVAAALVDDKWGRAQVLGRPELQS